LYNDRHVVSYRLVLNRTQRWTHHVDTRSLS
jgi:hypothetical protein